MVFLSVLRDAWSPCFLLRSRPSLDGLYPNCFERGKGKITFGADGDSFYEYLVKVRADKFHFTLLLLLMLLFVGGGGGGCEGHLLTFFFGSHVVVCGGFLVFFFCSSKVWLQTGRTDERLWRMYNAAIDGMDKWLVQKGDDGLTYLMNLNWCGCGHMPCLHAHATLCCV